MKLRLTGIKRTNKHGDKRAQGAVIIHLIDHAVLPETFQTDMHPLTLCHHPRPRHLAPHYHPRPCSCSCIPPCLLWSSQQTSGPARRATYHKLSPLSTAGCGAKVMRCQALLKQERINVSAWGWRAGRKSYTANEDRGDYLGDQRIMAMQKALKEHTMSVLIDVLTQTKHVCSHVYCPNKCKQYIHCMLYMRKHIHPSSFTAL